MTTRTISNTALLCLAAGFSAGATAAPSLAEDEEESPTIERELRTRRRPVTAPSPAPSPTQEVAPAAKLSGSYGLSLARVSVGERVATLPFAIQWNRAGGTSALALESDGPAWSHQGGSSASGMSNIDLWARWTPSMSSLSAKFGLTVGSRSAIGNDFDRAFAHLYQKVPLDPQLTALFVLGVRQRINHRQPDRGVTGEMVAELSHKFASASPVQSALVKITRIKPQARSGTTKVRLGADAGVGGGTLTPTLTRKLSAGGGSTTLAVDWFREF